uniref:C-type lectin domain-containing protein n=1 Tax=Fundulus heteroclitus TaxID=8078 RepID=A0A3Q2QC62_FUNHE
QPILCIQKKEVKNKIFVGSCSETSKKLNGEAGRLNFCIFKVRIGRMCRAILHMLVLLISRCQPSVENDVEVTASCPQDQRAFRGSCFEFVGQQLPFHRAQDWCEESGGHLAFIPDEETQNFLERHLDTEKDLWLGLAQSSSPKRWFSVHAEGKMAEKQNSRSSCGYILRGSGFQWEATKDCNKNMHFICQFGMHRESYFEQSSTL